MPELHRLQDGPEEHEHGVSEGRGASAPGVVSRQSHTPAWRYPGVHQRYRPATCPRDLVDLSVLRISEHACERFAERILKVKEPQHHDRRLARRIIASQLRYARRVEPVNEDEAFALARCVVLVRENNITTVYTPSMHMRRHD